jgi:hypothetical protein
LAVDVNDVASAGVSVAEIRAFRRTLARIIANLNEDVST